MITLIEDQLDTLNGEACLVKDDDDNYFVVSTLSQDTMAFRADPEGRIRDWLEVAGGENMTREEVFDCLARGDWQDQDGEPGFDREWYSEEDWEDWYQDDPSLLAYDDYTDSCA